MEKSSRNQWKLILVPFSWLYGLVVWIRNFFYDQGLFKSTGFNMPVISVGNITLGGTGKTPHTEYLIELMGEEFKLAVLSRGYRRKTREFRIAAPESRVQDIGDESMQIKGKYPDVVVAVDRKRVHGISELMKLTPALEVVILDDAYQHRSLRPGYSILLIDYNRSILDDRLLPAGRLRENARNRNRAHVILVTKAPEDMKPIEMREYVNRLQLQIGQHLFFTCMHHGELSPLFPENAIKGSSAKWYSARKTGILLISGVVHPQGLLEYAQRISTHIVELKNPDHHNYASADFERIMQLSRELSEAHSEVLILTTEKDAVKLRELDFPAYLRGHMHSVPIGVHFLNNDKENFDKQIFTYVTSNKRGNVLHQEEN